MLGSETVLQACTGRELYSGTTGTNEQRRDRDLQMVESASLKKARYRLPAPERKRTTTWADFIRARIGERSLRRALHDYQIHYYAERNDQGKGNVLLLPAAPHAKNRADGFVHCKKRLGGLLKYYYREAA